MKGILIDFGMGNLSALRHKLFGLDPHIAISSEPEDIASADYLILPGVGHFSKAMANLKESGILPKLNEAVLEKKTPILGICVGMQLFAETSEEGEAEGLGWIDAKVQRFPYGPMKIPHIGWNSVKLRNEQLHGDLFSGIEPDQRFYFIHSYRMICRNANNIAAVSDYGGEFTSVVRKDNIAGVQFHPEKSHRRGLKIIENFLRLSLRRTDKILNPRELKEARNRMRAHEKPEKIESLQ